MNYQDYKLLIDTDIGDDIDDAFAVSLAMKTHCNIVGVTTVFKNTKYRALQAKELLSFMKEYQNVNVYYGNTYPLNGTITPFFFHEDDLANVPPCQYDESMQRFKVEEAEDIIIKMAKKYSKKLVILAIGPLTNIATALIKDPSIANDIAAIYIMGGSFAKSQPEWNVICDVEATDIVYKSKVNIYAVGIDITMQCPLEGTILSNMRNSNDEMIIKLFEWFDRWMNYFHFEKSVLHDPLALSTFIDSDICKFEKKYCKVILNGENRGSIDVKDDFQEGYMPINAAVSVDKEKFEALIKTNFR